VGRQDTVLIVEDDDDVRDALSELLALEGYAAVGAQNGREALERLKEGPRPCVILLDLMMPVMDGWQFRAAQVADPAISSIPVIVVSADASVEAKAASVGAATWLRKPVDAAELFHAVAKYR